MCNPVVSCVLIACTHCNNRKKVLKLLHNYFRCGFMCHCSLQQEAFEKCWAHSPLRAAARRLFYIAIHQVSLLSHATTVARRLRIDVHNNNNDDDDNNNDRGDRYGPIEWAQLLQLVACNNCTRNQKPRLNAEKYIALCERPAQLYSESTDITYNRHYDCSD